MIGAIVPRLFSMRTFALGIAGAFVAGSALGGWAAWSFRDAQCDAAYWKEEARQKQAIVDTLNAQVGTLKGRIEERDTAAQNDAERAAADAATRATLEGAIREVAFKVANGSCFSAGTVEWLRERWPALARGRTAGRAHAPAGARGSPGLPRK
ncbi:MAG: hypothetical protein WD871_01740 [Xanthobacteraceae bacterium]